MFKYLICILIFTLTLFEITAQNRVLNLDGDADYAFANHDNSLSITDAVTIAVWVKINSNNTTSSIARKGATFTPAYSLNRESSNNFKFYTHFGSWLSSPSSTTVTTVGEWYHIAGVYDGSEIMIYVNGILEASTPNTGSISTTTDNFYIGGDVGGVGAHFDGLIDELSVWDKALTKSQIQTVMDDSLSVAYYQTTDSGLVAYWKFDELEDLGINSDGADDVRDLSVNGNHADLEGNAFIEMGGPVGVESVSNEIPVMFSLRQNHPNPFNPNTNIQFSLPQTSYVTLEVFNALGESVGLLVSQELTTGTYNYVWDATTLPSGIYFYRLQAGDFIQTKKMILMK